MNVFKIFGLLLILFCLSGCGEDSGSPNDLYSAYKPILMDTNSLFRSINFKPGRDVNNRGRVYVDAHNLYVVEYDLGVHFYDNANPSSPVQTGFLNVPGITDMQVVNQTMYVNNAVDMVAINITNPANPVPGKRVRNVFPEPNTPDGLEIVQSYAQIPKNAVIVGWEKLSQ